MGLEIPVVYFLFYEYFVKSSVGDQRWRKACVEATHISAPLGSPQAEAFAMLLLKNNYFAWLLEAKEKLQDLLITDYDPEGRRAGMTSVAEVYLRKLQLNIRGQEGEDVLIPEGHEMYDDLKKGTDDMLKITRQLAKNNDTYKEVETALEAMSLATTFVGVTEDNSVHGEDMKRERQRKRRKMILKPFREHTA